MYIMKDVGRKNRDVQILEKRILGYPKCDKCTQKERLTVKIYEEMPPGRRRGTTVTKM